MRDSIKIKPFLVYSYCQTALLILFTCFIAKYGFSYSDISSSIEFSDFSDDGPQVSNEPDKNSEDNINEYSGDDDTLDRKENSLEENLKKSKESELIKSELYTPIHLDHTKELIEVTEPSADQIRSFLDAVYQGQKTTIEQMQKFIVGIKGQNRLLTLSDAYKEKLLSPEEAGAILANVESFHSGEISTLRLRFGLRRGEDIVIGRYPENLIARPVGMDGFNPNDPALGPFIKWLEILSHMTSGLFYGGDGAVSPNTETAFYHDVQLHTLTASIAANYWNEKHERALGGGAGVSGYGFNSYLETSSTSSSHGLWFSIMDGWAGLGYSSKINIEEKQLGLSALGVGAYVGAWKDYVQFGASVSVVGPSGSSFGVGGVITLSKDRVTTYLHKYDKDYDELVLKFIDEYQLKKKILTDELTLTNRLIKLMEKSHLLDDRKKMQEDVKRIKGEISQLDTLIKQYQDELDYLRDKHFIEVIDKESKGLRVDGGVHIEGIGMGFRAGGEKATSSIHRFYTQLDRAQELLKDGDGSRLAFLRLPEKFDIDGFPDLRDPHKMKVGEEVITTIDRTFYGSIVVGLEAVPGIDIRAGLSSTVTGTFEVGARKLPGNKLEVTFKPSEIREMGAFIAAINVVGPQLSIASTVALAMRMTFIFDLDNKDAVDIYSLFLTSGILPIGFSAADAVVGPREAENLLDVASIHRKALAEKGVLLTYLEKMDIPAKKFYAGIAKIPAISSKHWAGLSFEYLKGQAKVVSTDGQIAVSRFTSHVSQTASKGRSGIEETSAYATTKRVFMKSDGSEAIFSKGEDLSDGYIWRFKGLTLRAKLSDSKIIRNDQQRLVVKLNRMFHANLKPFLDRDGDSVHKQTREILLERHLTSKDLDEFKQIKQSRIDIAVRGSHLSRSEITDLLADLEDKGHNQMADILKNFVYKHGIKGVSAIHLLLNGGSRNIVIRTSSDAYSEPLERVHQLEAMYANPKSDGKLRYLGINFETSDRKIKKIFKDINEVIGDLDQALIDLAADPLLEGEDDLLKFEHGQREKKSVLRSKLLAAKNQMLDMIDLEKQGFDHDTIVATYRKIRAKHRSLGQRIYLLKSEFKRPISLHEKRKKIAKRWIEVSDFIKDIKKEQDYLSDSHIRQVLCDVYIERREKELAEFLNEATALINLDHLRDDGQSFITKMRKRKSKIFPAKAIYREIAAHIERILYQGNNL